MSKDKPSQISHQSVHLYKNVCVVFDYTHAQADVQYVQTWPWCIPHSGYQSGRAVSQSLRCRASPSLTQQHQECLRVCFLKASLCVLFPLYWLQRAANVPVIPSQRSGQYKVSPTFSGTYTRKFFTSSPMRKVYAFEAPYSTESITLRGRRMAQISTLAYPSLLTSSSWRFVRN